jgi:hypothetical protein
MRAKNLYLVLTILFALIAGIALLRIYAQADKERPGQDHKEQQQQQQEGTQTPSGVFVRNGKTVIRLSAEDQTRAGIETVSLKLARERNEIAVPATVLDAQGLVGLSSGYATAEANLRTAESNLSVSQREYDRLKILYSSQQNVSAKAFQAAEGALHNDQSSVALARQDLEFRVAALQQSWGNEIANWVTAGSKLLTQVLSRQDALVQLTLTRGDPRAAPREVLLELPNQGRATATLVSRFPRVDPRIQGDSFLYVAKGQGALAPGLNLIADLSTGPRVAGVRIPASAVIWLNGDPWVYVQTASDEFTRLAISTNHPVAGGFFLSQGPAAGDRIVRAGAQMLLSAEFHTQGQSEAGADTD